jgi:hypothetical protein
MVDLIPWLSPGQSSNDSPNGRKTWVCETESMNSVLEADECSYLDVDRLRGKDSSQPFNYSSMHEGSLFGCIEILRGNGVERSVVKSKWPTL